MKFIHKKISIFLACNLFIVTLFAVPKYQQEKKWGTSQIEISDAGHLKMQGYTKNEITSTQQNVDQSPKDSKTFKYLDSNIFAEILQFSSVIFTQINLLFFTGTIQLARKELIFPFHSFW